MCGYIRRLSKPQNFWLQNMGAKKLLLFWSKNTPKMCLFSLLTTFWQTSRKLIMSYGSKYMYEKFWKSNLTLQNRRVEQNCWQRCTYNIALPRASLVVSRFCEGRLYGFHVWITHITGSAIISTYLSFVEPLLNSCFCLHKSTTESAWCFRHELH